MIRANIRQKKGTATDCFSAFGRYPGARTEALGALKANARTIGDYFRSCVRIISHSIPQESGGALP
jgi:hypothetical protein